MTEKLRIGIDFGTSNSSVGSYSEKGPKIYKPTKGALSQPSSIFIRADGFHTTGVEAVENFTSEKEKKDTYHWVISII